MKYSPKDPDEIDDFRLDWAPLLATGETITTFTAVTAASDVTVGATSYAGSITTARISAGTLGATARVRYRIITSTGRQLDITIIFSLMEA